MRRGLFAILVCYSRSGPVGSPAANDTRVGVLRKRSVGFPGYVDMLRHLMEAKGFTQAQLSMETAVPKCTTSEILTGKRHSSQQMIRKFADYVQVRASLLAANF